MQNSGLSDLAFIDVDFPNEKIYGRTNLHVEWNGHEVRPEKLPPDYQAEHPDTLRLPCNPPWPRREQRSLQIDYSFVAPGEQGTRMDSYAAAPEPCAGALSGAASEDFLYRAGTGEFSGSCRWRAGRAEKGRRRSRVSLRIA
jgi:hypothetical protein